MENSIYYKLVINMGYYLNRVLNFLSVFYIAVPVDYDCWKEPHDVNEVYNYLFPRQGWVCKGLYWLYSFFVYCMNIVTYILANICNLPYIANIELYR